MLGGLMFRQLWQNIFDDLIQMLLFSTASTTLTEDYFEVTINTVFIKYILYDCLSNFECKWILMKEKTLLTQILGDINRL